MKYIIKVNELHISNGMPCHQSACPVAAAIEEQLPGIFMVLVTELNVRLFFTGSRSIMVALPDHVGIWMNQYDRAAPANLKLPEPFEFELEVNP